jgi:rhamnogalacturonyl hydrolase YesR
MALANKYFMDKWPDPGANIVTNKSRPSNLWTRGTYYEGLMAFYYLTRDTSFYQYAVDWGTKNSWKPTYVTLPIKITDKQNRIADNHCCGQTYIELYNIDPKPERIRHIDTVIGFMVDSAKVNDWWWIDALHMAMPVFAKLGVLHNNNTYFERMHDLFSCTKSRHGKTGLYNTTEHLWWRDSSFLPPYTTPAGKNCYWSRGNGWVFAALARTLDVMPENAPYRSEYLTIFQDMAEALRKLQRTDGFWNPSLMDSTEYGGKETSGTAFFTFGMAWGINHGFLDSATFYPVVAKGWNGMINDALHTNGFLGWVQGAGSKPADSQPLGYDKAPDFEDFTLGAFLLAGSEVYKLTPVCPQAIASDIKGDTLICSRQNVYSYNIQDNSTYATLWIYSGRNVTITPSALSASIVFSDSATSGILSAIVFNCNGASDTSYLPIGLKPILSSPSLVTGSDNNSFCPGSEASFSVPLMPDADSYHWSFSGQGTAVTPNTNTVLLHFSDAATSGYLKVVAVNCAGVSDTSELVISIQSPLSDPGLISGPDTVYVGSNVAFEVHNDSIANYSWTYGNDSIQIISTSYQCFVKVADTISGNIVRVAISSKNGCGQDARLQKSILVLQPDTTTEPNDTTVLPTGIAEIALNSVSVLPNPFSIQTTISYVLSKTAQTSILIYNHTGVLVASPLTNTMQAAGMHRIVWNGTSVSGEKLSKGIYLIVIRAGNSASTCKVVVF